MTFKVSINIDIYRSPIFVGSTLGEGRGVAAVDSGDGGADHAHRTAPGGCLFFLRAGANAWNGQCDRGSIGTGGRSPHGSASFGGVMGFFVKWMGNRALPPV